MPNTIVVVPVAVGRTVPKSPAVTNPGSPDDGASGGCDILLLILH